MAESGTEPALKEEIKPSVDLLVNSSPEDTDSREMLLPGFASIKSEPQELDGTSRFGIQSDVKPIVIKPDLEDHGPMVQGNIRCGNNIPDHNMLTTTYSAEFMKWKAQRVGKLVPSILAKNPKFNGAKIKSISLLSDPQKDVIRCKVDFSTAHKPAQLTVSDNTDDDIEDTSYCFVSPGSTQITNISSSGTSFLSPRLNTFDNTNYSSGLPRNRPLLRSALTGPSFSGTKPSYTTSSQTFQDTETVSSKCPHCLKSFPSKGELKSHLRSTHGSYQCKMCYQCFQKDEMLTAHYKLCPWSLPRLALQNGNLKKCLNCKMIVGNEKFVKFHVRVAKQSNLFESCSECFQKSDIFKMYLDIAKEVKYGKIAGKIVKLDKPHSVLLCETCNTVFDPNEARISALKEHICNHMRDLQMPIVISVSYKCLKCHGALFTSPSDYDKHMKKHLPVPPDREHDTLGRTRLPPEPYMSLADQGGTPAHEQESVTSTPQRETKINIFNDKGIVIQKYSLNCLMCSKFSSPNDLHRHLAIFSPSVPYRCFKCTQDWFPTSVDSKNAQDCFLCVKKFASFDHLKNHLSIHTQLWEYNCDKCSQGFNSIAEYISHKRDHDGFLFSNTPLRNESELAKEPADKIEGKDYRKTIPRLHQEESNVTNEGQAAKKSTEKKEDENYRQRILRLRREEGKMDICDVFGKKIREYDLSCKRCKFHSQDDFHRHLAQYSPSVPYLCEPCLSRRRAPCPLDPKIRLDCVFCGKYLSSFAALKDHLSVHTHLYKHNCDVCHQGFNILSTLNRHTSSHCKERKEQERIRMQGSAIPRLRQEESNVTNEGHMAKSTEKNEGENYRQRILRLHREEGKMDICDVFGKKLREYDLHCGKCKFHSQSDFHRHLAQYSPSVPYLCEPCLRRERAPLPLDPKIRTDCIFCGKCLSTFNKLRDHLAIHTNLFKYYCDGCYQGYITSFGLKSHVSRCKEHKKQEDLKMQCPGFNPKAGEKDD